jgi:arylsulfatase A-like enzyme
VNEQVWAFWDVLPTLAELTGQSPPGELDGISILPALLKGEAVEHPPLYFEFHERGFSQAARIGDWKGVRLAPGQPLELFDLKTDVAEAKNVAAEHPEVVKQLGDFLTSARTDSELWPIQPARPAGGKKKGKGKQP